MTAPSLLAHRLAEDAEAAAQRGHRHAALQLATLALDVAGHDPALLWRVVGVREAATAGAWQGETAVGAGSAVAVPVLPEVPVDTARVATPFGAVPADSPFGDDGPRVGRRVPLAPNGVTPPRVVARGNGLGVTDPFLVPDTSGGGWAMTAGAGMALAICALLFALLQPLTAGRLLDDLGWRTGAIFLLERAAGTPSEAATANAILGEWFLERGKLEAAATHYRVAAQLGLPWERIPEIVAALKGAGAADGAAEVLLAAFGAGAPPEAWPVIIQELALLGRTAEAHNMRQMLRTTP